MDGIRVCRLIRRNYEMPIIMLTARDSLTDKVLGLESGADDYLVKPFEYLELAARIKACLRRSPGFQGREEMIRAGDLRINTNTKSALKEGKEISLTGTEFELLALLARNKGRALSRETIKQQIWDKDALYSGTRVIDVHIQHLRSKLGDDPDEPRYIRTVPGVGYMLSIPEL
jgi:DNA-binding response OmpR family regulator